MRSFQVKQSSYGFPEETKGVLVPDFSEPGRFFESEVERYAETNDKIIALYINELQVSAGIVELMFYHRENRLSIVTFGVLGSLSEAPVGTSHFDTFLREEKIPLIHLVKPDGYPRLMEDWVDNNPLSDLFHSEVTVQYSDQRLTIAPSLV